jgi:N-acetylated-alpha-linked acidic dipeptidase
MKVALLVVLALPLAAQSPASFSPARASQQIQLEHRLLESVDTATARRHSRELAARPHVAGSEVQLATADYVLHEMMLWGLDTFRVEFNIFLPYHDSTVVELHAGKVERFNLDEPPIAGDPTTAEPAWPAMNAYSGQGDVTAPLIYVNYGLAADYARLDSMGVSVRGKVVLARYGRAFRGIKPREAAARGAVGVLLYSDPLDDGFLQGEVYPQGPMRNADGVQRGSIKNGQGDPSTPGWPSVEGAKRLSEADMDLPTVPVVPIGYGNAARLLAVMQGPVVPDGWQGGIKQVYRLGDSTIKVRVAVWPERGEEAYKKIANTFGVIRGAEFPDEVIIVGAHRDAWSPGALDNVSGVVSVLEAARSWSTAVAAGMRPRRTLMFATWDAEEWGLIGSTEWVELMADSLRAHAIAYINQDVVASGPSFSASGTASLHDLIRDVTKAVPQPGDTVSVYRDWQRRTVTSLRPEPAIGDLGGGSDFVGFYNHLGIPSIGFGFGGPGGSYHSGYDTYTFIDRFSDPDYEAHRAAAQVTSLLMARLANADVLPLNHGNLGRYLIALVDRTRRAPRANEMGAALDALAAAAGELAVTGDRFEAARAVTLAGDISPALSAAVNRSLRAVELELIDMAGLDGRPFMRNVVFASDRDDGYANVQFPAVVEHLRDGDIAGAKAAAAAITARVSAANRRVHETLERLRAR